MKIVSHMRSATSMSCVEKITVDPLSRSETTASLSTSMLTGSRPLNGSSSTISCGCETTVAMNWTFWDMPLDSVSTFLSAHVREVQPLEPRVDLAPAVTQTLELSIENQDVAHLHLLVQPALFRQIADTIIGANPVIAPQHADVPLVRIEDPQDHPQRRGLAGSVRTDEAVDRTLGHDQIEVIHGHLRPETFRHLTQFNGIRHIVFS